MLNSYLDGLDKNYASRVMRVHTFDVPLLVLPAAPANVTITNVGTSGQYPHLTWSSSSGATSYKVYRCFDNRSDSIDECSNVSNWTLIVTTGNTYADDYGLTTKNTCYIGGVPYKFASYYVRGWPR